MVTPKHEPWSEDVWRRILTVPSEIRWKRGLRRMVPANPRCKMCNAPFGGPAGAVFSLFNGGPWPRNPNYCGGCFRTVSDNHGGAEIDCSVLFADVRGSTTLAEDLTPKAFNRLMGRFHDIAADVLIRHEAIVDKFVGDEIVGLFLPAMAGPEHPAQAVDSARELLRETGNWPGRDRLLPIGVGVSSGIAYVGSVGEGSDSDFTAMGDLVNTTARLASAAAAGEVLVTEAAASRSGLPVTELEHRALALKGKTTPTNVVVVGISG